MALPRMSSIAEIRGIFWSSRALTAPDAIYSAPRAINVLLAAAPGKFHFLQSKSLRPRLPEVAETGRHKLVRQKTRLASGAPVPAGLPHEVGSGPDLLGDRRALARRSGDRAL